MSERKKVYFDIPEGRRPKPCEACGTPLYFVQQPSGSWMPVEVDEADEQQCEPTRDSTGTGITHFGNCPEADKFRKRAGS